MKLGIMQPYFFPYIGYFSLIKHTDFWVVFDTPQFMRHGWVERNRILKPDGIEWQYVKAPLEKFGQKTAIKDLLIKNTTNWEQKILAQLQHYKKKSPYYQNTLRILEEVFCTRYTSITDLNNKVLEIICKYLSIDFKYVVFSSMDLDTSMVSEPDEWALEISKSLKAEEYINPIGGLEFFDRSKYEKENIKIHFQRQNIKEYKQLKGEFVPGLSILDVLMFNSPEEINIMLDDFELV